MGIGPSTKETTKHHFQDPLVELLQNDKDLDFCGIVVYGTSDISSEKHRNSYRAAQNAIAMRADGVIITIDGWGNSHVDYENCIRHLGKVGIPVVGLSFVGKAGAFVVKNKYMDTIVDFNKSKDGVETEIIGENNKDELDCRKAVALLKLKMKKEGI